MREELAAHSACFRFEDDGSPGKGFPFRQYLCIWKLVDNQLPGNTHVGQAFAGISL